MIGFCAGMPPNQLLEFQVQHAFISKVDFPNALMRLNFFSLSKFHPNCLFRTVWQFIYFMYASNRTQVSFPEIVCAEQFGNSFTLCMHPIGLRYLFLRLFVPNSLAIHLLYVCIQSDSGIFS